MERYLQIPCSATGVGYVTADPHAPNENIDLGHLFAGAKFMAAIMNLFGREAVASGSPGVEAAA